MALKTYVLLEHTRPTAPIYQRVNATQRVRLDKRPVDHAYLKQTFTTPEGKNRTARLKLNCDTIWQDEQIKPEVGVLANEPFTQQERDAVKFNYEFLHTKNETVQKYLESVPQFDGWWDPEKIGKGSSTESPLYTVLNKELEAKVTNAEFKKRLKAANKIAAIEDLKEMQDLMIRLNGSFFTPPDNEIDCQNLLIEYVDDANDEMLDALLKEDKDVSIDEKVTILIGRAINEEIISFEAIPNQVAKKQANGGWKPVKEISSTYPLEERKRYFAEFLTIDDGKLLRRDLEKEIEKNETKNTKLKT
jgi:hypothetical protein